jgi:hypothetical protein
VRPPWLRIAAALALASSLAIATGSPAAARDLYPFFGPLEIRITGANGELRSFIALSPDDTGAANALVRQITGAMQAPGPTARDSARAATTLPHYQIGVSHLAEMPVTLPWASHPTTRFVYYPGQSGSIKFLMVEFSSADAGLQDRWVVPSAQVAGMLDRHLQGLLPMGTDLTAVESTGSPPWGLWVAACVLIGLTLLLVEDRRRWQSRW